ncbi:acylneuraminate cytidylyltransferase family protein [Nonlabens marinus]|uniref:N-Acetylneuraminate cytidylyltransferase n=1 Tax=Nonlabens marinus S1-08 TaxID=1454201 RepID=W8VVU0_9FLAO|nr:acylneuraminate cytidylyltransferase family protein [Nonlabens marinus]BAO55743.1 N-Acetylneuraminate cytidylyltransferase [Nonlabens marinus S1-08]
MKTLTIIPARGGSKRLPGKNLMELGSQTLLEHSIAFAKANSSYMDAIVVSTDDEAIAKVAESHGVAVVMRPAVLASDTSTTVEALKHVLEQPDYPEVETLILLQPTNPLRPSSLLEDAMETWNSHPLDTLFTCSRMTHKFGSIKNNQFHPENYRYGQRSQDLKPLFYENGLLYICSAKSIKKGIMIDENHYAMVVDHEYASIDIDNQADLDYARYIWQRDNS